VHDEKLAKLDEFLLKPIFENKLSFSYFQVDVADDSYPRSISKWWYGCEKGSSMKSSEESAGKF